jgi:hypothetical protein
VILKVCHKETLAEDELFDLEALVEMGLTAEELVQPGRELICAGHRGTQGFAAGRKLP